MQLPARLAHWAPLLQLFPDDIVSELGDLVRALSSLIGPLRANSLKGLQEPNGYAGITKHANYHRLLMSEWVFMDAYQDEFLRRAVSGEHLFHLLEHVEPKVAKSSYVLFDCGPAQLGKPRVAQLALLILLARRAEKAEANFYWGVLQDNTRTWHNSIDIQSITQWLNLRSTALASDTDICQWLSKHSEIPEDCWVISPESLDANDKLKKIVIDEMLFDDMHLKITVTRTTHKKEIKVQLPSLAVQTKLLRNPFSTIKRAQTTHDWCIESGWQLSPNGSLLAYMGPKNTVCSIRVPNAGNKKIDTKDNFIIPDDHKVAGVYITRKKMCVIYCSKTHVHLHNFPNAEKLKSIELKQAFYSSEQLNALIITSDAKHKTALLVLDSKKNLRKLRLDGDSLLSTVAQDVIYLAHIENCQFYVSHDRARSRITLTWLVNSCWPQEMAYPVETVRAPLCYIHGSQTWSKYKFGIFAYQFNDHIWKIVAQGFTKSVSVSSEQIIVGVLFLNNWVFDDGTPSSQVPCLVAIDKERIHVDLLFEDKSRSLFKLPSVFVRGELNRTKPLLHYVNDHEECVTVCLKTGSELLRFGNTKDDYAD